MTRRSIRGLMVVLVAVIGLGACARPPPSLGSPALDAGRTTYGLVCATCHGGNGQGGAGPALAAAMETFPDCASHQQWIELGSARWTDEVGPTIGASDREITKVMPGFEGTLTLEEIAQVAAFERLRFGGATLEQVTSDCGLG